MQNNNSVVDTPNQQILAQANIAKWFEALETKDANNVAQLYAQDATFLPTVSGDFKKGTKGAKEYFAHFLQKNPTGKVIEQVAQTLTPESYVHSGMYNFELGPDDARQTVEARFTFVWVQNMQGEWKIIHHHSSVRP